MATSNPPAATSNTERMADLFAEDEQDAAATDRTCPGCGAPMAADDVLCIACGMNQKSGRRLQTSHEPEDEFEDDPFSAESRPSKRSSKGSMKLVALGIGLFYWALLLGAGMLLVAFFSAIGGVIAGPAILALGLLLAVIGLIAAVVMSMVGWLLCLFVPSRTGAKGLIFVSLGLALASVLSPVLIVPAIAAEMQDSITPGMLRALNSLVPDVLYFASQISFMLFLGQLATFLKRPDLEERAQTLIKYNVTLVLLPLAVIPLVALPRALGAFLMCLAILFLVTVFVALLIRLASLLRDLRKGILGHDRR